jgi:polar amino acid transport system substrate-binding protein
VYGNPTQWTVIFYANQDRLGGNVSLLMPGLALRLPCIGAQAPAAAPAPVVSVPSLAPSTEPQFIISSLLRRVEFLTADGFSPYTGRSLEGGGMLTQVINSAMILVKEEAKGRFDFGISWVNDWAAHLNPLLLTRAFDVGFPWARPDCEAPNLDQSSQFRCQRFFFSDPLYEVITALFVRSNSKIRSLRREDVAGRTLCRPAGYPIHELDKAGRNWVKDGLVTLMRPPSVDECFRLLDNGTVDGVAEAELAGRASIVALGLGDKVRMLDQPLALTTYHVLVSKSHPHARTILYYVNASLEKLREKGEYDRIVERHLARFWEAQAAGPSPAMGNVPAARAKSAPPPSPVPATGPAAKAGQDKK